MGELLLSGLLGAAALALLLRNRMLARRLSALGSQAVEATADRSPAASADAAALRARNDILQSILDNIPGGVTLFDRDLQMIACNRAAIELLGFPPKMFSGRLPSLPDLARFNAERGEYGEGDPATLAEQVVERARDPVAHCIERTRPDGVILEIRGAPLPEGGFVTIYTDVTERRRAEAASRRQAHYLRSILDHLPQGISVFDADLRLRCWNTGLAEVLELPPESVFDGASFDDLLMYPARRGEYGPGDPAQLVAQRRALALKFEAHRFERTRPNGRTHLVEGKPMLLDGEVVGFITSYTDITHRIEVESELRTRNQVFGTLVDNIPGGVTLFDGQFRLVASNDAYRRLLDFPDHLFENEPTLERFFRFNAARGEYGECDIEAKVTELLERARQRVAHRFERTRPDGTVLEIRGLPLADGGFVTIYTDVTEHKRALEAVEQLAHHDTLTGLANRYALEARLDQSLAEASRNGSGLGLLFIDMDNFKAINDALGHAAGDQFLIEIANRLRSCLRESDIVSRPGGDEFVIAITRLAEASAAAKRAREILAALSRPMMLDNEQIVPSASIGISVFPADGSNRGTLMKNADIAMYSAKGAGRNAFRFFDPAMTEVADTRLSMEGALRGALEREELVLHYQPKIDAEHGRLVGFEALLRWQRDNGELVPPLRFIPLAEETGLIVPIGEWVLRTACRTLQAWRAEGMSDTCMAINLSARQLRTDSLVDLVAEVLHETGVPSHLLELEITESAAMDDPERTAIHLRALKSLGVRISIDDFGTGYSSLAYLKLLPIDVLKLDRTFVKDIESDPNDAAICAATIGLAHTLGLRVVAEGVETAAQVAYLGHLKCDLMQGFLFSHPLPADQARAYLAPERPLIDPDWVI